MTNNKLVAGNANTYSQSEKVRADYTAHLKEGEYLYCLLDFTFQFLGHSRGKPVDASSLDITKYTFDTTESPIKDIQWLLTHLYYLCLKHLPTLTKAWWIDCKSRQTVVNVESWTERFVRKPPSRPLQSLPLY